MSKLGSDALRAPSGARSNASGDPVAEFAADVALARHDYEVDIARDRLAIAQRDLQLATTSMVGGAILAVTGGGLLVTGVATSFAGRYLAAKVKAASALSSALEARERAIAHVTATREAGLMPSSPAALDLSGWQDLSVGPPGASEQWIVRATDASVSRPRTAVESEMPIDSNLFDELVRQAPKLAELMTAGQTFELIGPGVALEGLRNGLLELVPAKGGGLLGAVRAVGGTQFEHQARFAIHGAFSAAAPGLAISIASAVLGHMHMVEIRKSLAQIEGKLKSLQDGERSRRFSAVHGPIHSLEEVMTELAASHGLDEPARVRLDRLGDELAKACFELAQQQQTFASNVSKMGAPSIGELNTYFSSRRRYECDDARLLLDGRSALVIVKRLRLEHERRGRKMTEVFERQLDAAISDLRAVETEIDYSFKLHQVCRAALDEEHASTIRLRSGHTEHLGKHLRDDRIELANLVCATRQRVAALASAAEARVVRVDASGPKPRAWVALLEADALFAEPPAANHEEHEPRPSSRAGPMDAKDEVSSDSRPCPSCQRKNPRHYSFCIGCGGTVR